MQQPAVADAFSTFISQAPMKRFLPQLLLAVYCCLLVLPTQAQIALNPDQYRVFDKDGKPATLAQIVGGCKNIDVLFLGEEHNDAVGHALQAEIFKQVVAQFKASRKVALSMEMFERDTQIVLDEYLSDLITEKQLLSNARPWQNYAQDYRPLVEQAKANGLPVIAANAPRRYVNLVTRKGRAALDALSPQAKSWLAPLPYGKSSEAYGKKFNALMGAAPGTTAHGHLGDSQALWDSTMAHSIAQYLKTTPAALVVQLNGKFHSESRLGTVEHLLAYQPAARVLVITISTDASFPEFDQKTQQGLGDFVILTDPKVEKSYK